MKIAPFLVLAVIALAGCGTDSPKGSSGGSPGSATSPANAAGSAKPDAGAPAGSSNPGSGW